MTGLYPSEMVLIAASELPQLHIDVDHIETLIQMGGDVEVGLAAGPTYTIVGTTLHEFIHCLFEPGESS
jgi:hypothetical protein